jgi:hypothetical protein
MSRPRSPTSKSTEQLVDESLANHHISCDQPVRRRHPEVFLSTSLFDFEKPRRRVNSQRGLHRTKRDSLTFPGSVKGCEEIVDKDEDITSSEPHLSNSIVVVKRDNSAR